MIPRYWCALLAQTPDDAFDLLAVLAQLLENGRAHQLQFLHPRGRRHLDEQHAVGRNRIGRGHRRDLGAYQAGPRLYHAGLAQPSRESRALEVALQGFPEHQLLTASRVRHWPPPSPRDLSAAYRPAVPLEQPR